jgi:hypothetical protein
VENPTRAALCTPGPPVTLISHWAIRPAWSSVGSRKSGSNSGSASRRLAQREGHYGLTVTLEFHGPLTAEQKARLLEVTARCPVHKLMTQVEISITTLAAQP